MIYFQKKIFTMFKELFGAACSKPPPLGIPVSPQSRAMYAIDLMLDWAIKPNGMHMYSSKFTWITRMHSSRMRTACSSSRQGGGVSTSVHAGIPPRCGPGDPPARPLNFPPGVRLETHPPPGQTPQLSLWVWAWRPAGHTGIPPPPPQLPARHAGIPPPPPPPPRTEFLSHASKNMTLPQTSFAGGN